MHVCFTKGKVHNFYTAEAKESKDITEKSDIYGFGLILIELMTGKSPTDAEFGIMHGNGSKILEWARYCYRDCHLDNWIDPIIRAQGSSHYRNQMVEIMNLALHCTAIDPTARPCATHIFKTLDQSMFRSTSSCVSAGLKFSSHF